MEANKAVALRFLKAMEDRDAEGVDAVLDDDASFWIIGDLPFSGTHGKPVYMGLIKGMIDACQGPLTIHVKDVTAEDDRVSITGVGEMTTKSGQAYNNDYHFLFAIRDGKIVRSREYVDTHMVYGLADIKRDG